MTGTPVIPDAVETPSSLADPYGDLSASTTITTIRAAALNLGCGSYEAYICLRGADPMIGALPITSIEWARSLDDVSSARFSLSGVGGRGAACCGVVSSVEPWSHELCVYRDGLRVWSGPVVRVDADGDDVSIEARDLMRWLWKRRLRRDHDYTDTDLAAIFEAYAIDALALDNSMGLVVSSSPCGIVGSRRVLALQHMICGDQLEELAQTGVDWTVIDRTVLVGGAVTPSTLTLPPLLTDESFVNPPRVTYDGEQQATDWLIRGAGVGDGPDAVYGEAGGVTSEYGLVDRVESNEEILDSGSAQRAAASRLALTGTEFAVVSEGVLTPNAPITISQLVPGQVVTIRLQSSCIPILRDYRLSSVGVSASGEQPEQVTIGLQPVGSGA